jgi:hypothetical protein
MEKKIRQRGLYHNSVSYFGLLFILISLLLIVSFLLISFTLSRPSPYLGIFTYMVFPGLLSLGILVSFYGIYRESNRRRMAAKEELRFPVLDLNKPRQRRLFSYFFVGGFMLLILLSVIGYRAYHFTDSVMFCGRVCHSVMKPEYTAYLNSPHARVPCVDCHVGSGVSWYVKSKISGVPQVFATLADTYPRPIQAPIKNLRPARETCEECHWPKKFYGAKLAQIPHFHYDQKNTPEQITLLIKTGGGGGGPGTNAGIHWHMIIENQIYFKATDRTLQHIPWIKLVLPDGSARIYQDRQSRLGDEEINKLPIHLMDCMDCHNRPTHLFPSPETTVNASMAGREISPSLPWIKKLAVDALVQNYKDPQNAFQGIRNTIQGTYAKNFPEVLKTRKAEVDQAIQAIYTIYQETVFSGMKVNWATYANNIGHRQWPGCFRCHDDRHFTPEGKVLSKSCTLCHTMPQRGPLLPLGITAPISTENWHQWPLQGKHAEILCNQCHKAGYPPPQECAVCHGLNPSAPMMSMGCQTCHSKDLHPMGNCQSCHGDIKGLHRKQTHAALPCSTCHTPHVWKVTSREGCLSCHGDKQLHHAPTFCGNCHTFA